MPRNEICRSWPGIYAKHHMGRGRLTWRHLNATSVFFVYSWVILPFGKAQNKKVVLVIFVGGPGMGSMLYPQPNPDHRIHMDPWDPWGWYIFTCMDTWFSWEMWVNMLVPHGSYMGYIQLVDFQFSVHWFGKNWTWLRLNPMRNLLFTTEPFHDEWSSLK